MKSVSAEPGKEQTTVATTACTSVSRCCGQARSRAIMYTITSAIGVITK